MYGHIRYINLYIHVNTPGIKTIRKTYQIIIIIKQLIRNRLLQTKLQKMMIQIH